jgi:hypothetical protein
VPRVRVSTTDTIAASGKTIGTFADNYAELRCWIAFGDAAVTPAPDDWIDVSTRVRGLSVKLSGRDFELDRFEAGTGTLRLESRDGDFAPENASSPYYPYVRPGRAVLVTAGFAGVVYPLFAGYAESFDPVWRGPKDETIVVRLVDVFKLLNMAPIQIVAGAWPAERTGSRFARAMAAAGLPRWRILRDLGLTTMASNDQDIDSGALAQIQDAELAENGQVWVGPDGYVNFADRALVTYDRTTSTMTFGNNGGAEIGYSELDVDYDDAIIRNWITVNDQLGTSTAVDSVSIAQYGRRSMSRDLPIANALERDDAAAFLAGVYAQPDVRISRLALPADLYANGSAWPWCLGLEVLDRVLVRHTAPTGQLLVQDSLISGVEHEIGQGLSGWKTAFSLTPMSPFGGWILGTDALDGDAVIGY